MLFSLLALSQMGCGQYVSVDALWTGDVVPSDGALYAQLPHAGAIARFSESAPAAAVDLDGAEPIRLVAAPDGTRILAFTRYETCDDLDPEIETTEDCLFEDLGYEYELAVLGSGGVEQTVNAPGHLQGVAFSPDSTTAVLYLDGAPTDVGGVADIDSVFFVNLVSGETATATVGVAPGNILFTPDGLRAVVLSRDSAVVVDLATFEVQVRYDLTLDADQTIDPSAAVLTPDGGKALVAMANLGVLYVLDLVDPSIDIEELPGRPVALSVDTDCNCTAIAYSDAAELDLLFHDDGSRVELELDVPVTQLVGYEGNVLAYGTGGNHDVYRVDLSTQIVTEYVVANPPVSVQVDDVGRYAVALMQPESSSGDEIDAYTDQRWGLSVLDLADDEPRNLMFDQMPMDYEVLTDDTSTYALVLLEGENTVQLIDLANPLPTTEIHLESSPLAAGSMGDGRFYIAQDSPLGLVSIVDPLAPDDIVEIGGFAAIGLYTDDDLPRRGDK